MDLRKQLIKFFMYYDKDYYINAHNILLIIHNTLTYDIRPYFWLKIPDLFDSQPANSTTSPGWLSEMCNEFGEAIPMSLGYTEIRSKNVLK